MNEAVDDGKGNLTMLSSVDRYVLSSTHGYLTKLLMDYSYQLTPVNPQPTILKPRSQVIMNSCTNHVQCILDFSLYVH